VLDAQVHVMLSILARSRRPTWEQLGAERGRREMLAQARLGGPDVLPVYRVDEASVETPDGGVRVRIYVPRAAPSLPATVYYHGGGFVLGDLDTHDALCRHLALRSESIVIAVDYRLAPEHPFPAAPEDACAAFAWVSANARELGVDARRIAVAGDSAGGNLAAVVAQRMRERGGAAPSFQLLIYPAVDLTRSFESHRRFANGFLLTEPMIDWFLASYLTNSSQMHDPNGSPIVTRDLSGLAPAHIVTAGFDPLRDEGEAYAEAMRAAGVPTTTRCYDSLIHGFVNMAGLVDAARHAIDDIAEVLRRALWS
jgi:acetyl esterase